VDQAMSGSERRWALVYSGVLALVTGIPYLLAYVAQGNSWSFTGFVFGVEDGNSYIAKMLAGAQGAWLFRTPYTTLPQQGVLAFLPYILLGKLAQGPALHEQLVALFHLFRTAAIPLEVYAVYRFASLFLEEELWRRWVTVLATAGGGLGWALLAIGQPAWLGSLPLDLHSPESFGFLALYGLPHLVVARSLLLISLSLYLGSEAAPAKAWLAGVALLGLALVQPIAVVSALAVLAAHLAVVSGRQLIRGQPAGTQPWLASAAKAALIPAPLVGYNVYAFSTDPYLRVWTAQNLILSPPFAHYLVAYGLVLVPAAVGGWRAFVSGSVRALLPVSWALAFPVLAYLPVGVQRRLPEGVWVALAILAALGFRAWAARRASLRRLTSHTMLALALLAASLPSTLILLAGGAGTALRPSEPAFLPRAEVEAFDWLRENVEPETPVLAAYGTANALPAWAPLLVPIGHGPESAGLERLLEEVTRFYAAESGDDFRRAFLSEHRIRVVIDGPDEAALGPWRPVAAQFMERVFSADGYSVYRVED
jgi:hypothetical protein